MAGNFFNKNSQETHCYQHKIILNKKINQIKFKNYLKHKEE